MTAYVTVLTNGVNVGGGGGGDAQVDPVFWNQKGVAFPLPDLGDTQAYFPSILFDDAAPFSPDGATFYKYVASYACQSALTPRQTFVFSNDGVTWVAPVKAAGILAAGYHLFMLRVGGNIRVWYWNPALLYTPNAMRTATCPVNSVPNFVGDTPCLNGVTPWIVGAGWNRGTYASPYFFYNPSPTSNPAVFDSWRYYGFVDVTSGATEDLAAIVSDDGVTWDLFLPAAVLTRGASGTWNSTYITTPTVWRDDDRWVMLYSGGVAQTEEGMGLAYSTDLVNWTEYQNNPVFHNGGGGDFHLRSYTPCTVDGSVLWYTGESAAGPRMVHRAEQATVEEKFYAFDRWGQGKGAFTDLPAEATYRVSADGPYWTVQGAINAAVADGHTSNANPALVAVSPKSGGWAEDVLLAAGVHLRGNPDAPYAVQIRSLSYTPGAGLTGATGVVQVEGVRTFAASGRPAVWLQGTDYGRLFVRRCVVDKLAVGGLPNVRVDNTGLSGSVKSDCTLIDCIGTVPSTGTAYRVTNGALVAFRCDVIGASGAPAVRSTLLDGATAVATFWGCNLVSSGTDVVATTTAAGSSVTINNSVLRNLLANSSGVNLLAGTFATILNSYFAVPAGAGYAVTGSGTYTNANNAYDPNANTKNTLTLVNLATAPVPTP